MVIQLFGKLASFLPGIKELGQGFGFGVGYGSGVRAGYEDVYPGVKDAITKLFNLKPGHMRSGYNFGKDGKASPYNPLDW